MRFVLEMNLNEEQHTAGFIAGYLESLAEGILRTFDVDTDMREYPGVDKVERFLICEVGLDEEKNVCEGRMFIDNEVFDETIHSYEQIATLGIKGTKEVREMRAYGVPKA